MAAAQSLDSLLDDHGDRFIPLEIFSRTASGGRYEIPWGRSRTFDFYNLAGYPTAWFDGVTSRIGDVDAYNAYLTRVNNRLAVPTDVLIDVSARRTGDRTYEVTAAVGLESTGVAKTVRVHLVEALDRFGVYDDNTTVPRNTLKYVLDSGLDVSLAPGQTKQITRSMTFDNDSWNGFGDIRLVAWAQAPAAAAPAEIYNAAQLSFADFLASDFDGNGLVAGADLGLWKGAFGKTAAGDANGDGRSDGRDFLAWQRAFGNSGPPVAGPAAAVPEPAAWVHLSAGVMFLLSLMPNRRVG
jgi:hypothetical protein